jgi:predicted nucleotidyltransferase
LTPDTFLARFLGWSREQDDILAVALVGSYARGTARPDLDIDLVLIAEAPERYLNDLRWTGALGDVLSTALEPYGRLTSVRVWYAGGIEVEFGFTTREWAGLPLDEGTQRVIAGMRVLFEREPLLSPLLPGT